MGKSSMEWRTGGLWRDVSGELAMIISAITQARVGRAEELNGAYFLKLRLF